MDVRAYTVLLEVRGPDGSCFLEVPVHAYSIQDAMVQASIETDARHAFFERGHKLTVASIVPTEAYDHLAGLLKELALLRMPPAGATA